MRRFLIFLPLLSISLTAQADITLVRAIYCNAIYQARDEIMEMVAQDAAQASSFSDRQALLSWIDEHNSNKARLRDYLDQVGYSATPFTQTIETAANTDLNSDASARISCNYFQHKTCPVSAATKRVFLCNDLSWLQ